VPLREWTGYGCLRLPDAWHVRRCLFSQGGGCLWRVLESCIFNGPVSGAMRVSLPKVIMRAQLFSLRNIRLLDLIWVGTLSCGA
jgi:hypothetical protein